MQSNRDKHRPTCLMAHDLINKLSAIVGYCDLLVEKDDKQDAERAKKLALIHELVKSAVKELVEHQCELSHVIRSANQEKTLIA